MKTEENLGALLQVHRLLHKRSHELFNSTGVSALHKVSHLSTKVHKNDLDSMRNINRKLRAVLVQQAQHYSDVDNACKLLAMNLLEGAVNRYRGNPPKLQHWISRCYFHEFSRGLQQGSKNCYAPVLAFGEETPRLTLANDKLFAHRPLANQSFYDNASEYFFAQVEGQYAASIRRISDGITAKSLDKAAFLSMMVVQLLRTPLSPSGEFKRRGFLGFAKELMRLMNELERAHLYVVSSPQALAFSPHSLVRVREDARGGRIVYFPLNSNHALLVSRRSLSVSQREEAVNWGRESLLSWAKRSGEALYGALPADY